MKEVLPVLIALIMIIPSTGQIYINAIDFDGDDDYAFAQHHPSLNPKDDSWSILLWIKAPDIIQEGPLVRKRLPEGGYNQYNLGIGNDDPHYIDPGKRIYVNYIDSAGISERSGYTENEFIDGDWHHIAFVADKSTDSTFIYLDGVKQNFIIKYNYGIWPDVGNNELLLIARNNSGSNYYKGTMDELSIWNKALDQNRIQQFMVDTLSPSYYKTPDSGLVAYYRFDEFEEIGAGDAGMDDIRDYSFYGNHIDTEGSPTLIPSGVFTDIPEEITHPEIYIYPNPAGENLFMEFAILFQQASVMEIFDSSGRKIIKKKIPEGTKTFEVDISSLKCGVYYCKMTIENKSVTKKLIIK